MLPRVRGLRSDGWDMMIVIFQSARLSRCCQMARRSLTKLSTRRPRSWALGSALADCAIPEEEITTKSNGNRGPENPGKKRPDMYCIVPQLLFRLSRFPKHNGRYSVGRHGLV